MKKSKFIIATSTLTLSVMGLFAKAEKKFVGISTGHFNFPGGDLTVTGLSNAHFTSNFFNGYGTVVLKTRGADTTLATMYTTSAHLNKVYYH